MKRFIVLLLAAMLLFCGCTKTDETKEQGNTKDTAVKEAVIDDEGVQDLIKGGFDETNMPKLGGYTDADNGLVYIDYADALKVWAYGEKDVELSDGTKGTSVIKLPILNAELDGAKECSKEMAQELYGIYGAYLDAPDDRIINMEFSSYDVTDFLVVIVTAHIKEPERSYDVVHTYYYDSLADSTLSMVAFVNMNGYQFADVYSAIIETDWALECKETTGQYPYEDVIAALTYNGEGIFDVYCTNADGRTQTKLTVEPEKFEINFDDMTLVQ